MNEKVIILRKKGWSAPKVLVVLDPELRITMELAKFMELVTQEIGPPIKIQTQKVFDQKISDAVETILTEMRESAQDAV